MCSEAFIKRIREACSRYEAAYETPLTLAVSGEVPFEVYDPTAHELYWILNEAIVNALKHSSSSRVEVSLQFHRDHFAGIVIDYGKGFDESTWKQKSSDHFGLSGMQERAREARAELSLHTSDKGTKILIKAESKRFYVFRK